jgi:hypothetical protein
LKKGLDPDPDAKNLAIGPENVLTLVRENNLAFTWLLNL